MVGETFLDFELGLAEVALVAVREVGVLFGEVSFGIVFHPVSFLATEATNAAVLLDRELRDSQGVRQLLHLRLHLVHNFFLDLLS